MHERGATTVSDTNDDTEGFTPVTLGGLALAAAVGGGLGLVVGGAYLVGAYQGYQAGQAQAGGSTAQPAGGETSGKGR